MTPTNRRGTLSNGCGSCGAAETAPGVADASGAASSSAGRTRSGQGNFGVDPGMAGTTDLAAGDSAENFGKKGVGATGGSGGAIGGGAFAGAGSGDLLVEAIGLVPALWYASRVRRTASVMAWRTVR